MNSDFKNAALILAGHGSTVNAESSGPTREQAESIRERGIFAEVLCSFWKEEPYFRDILAQVKSERIYLVPHFISEGYYTREVLPREFALEGRLTRKDGRELCYCEPVGLHPGMTDLLLAKARRVVGDEEVDPKETCLIVAGHGTPRNKNSTASIYAQVEKIRALGIYGECQAAFMEQEPWLKDWQCLSARARVVVVPFFIADGLHSFEDIPLLLGISQNVKESGFRNPTEVEGRKIWYASALGAEPVLADMIVDQARRFQEGPGGSPEA